MHTWQNFQLSLLPESLGIRVTELAFTKKSSHREKGCRNLFSLQQIEFNSFKALQQSPNIILHTRVLTVLSCTRDGNKLKGCNFVKTAGQQALSLWIPQTHCKSQRGAGSFPWFWYLWKEPTLSPIKTLNFACPWVEAHLEIVEYQICSTALSHAHDFNLLLGKKCLFPHYLSIVKFEAKKQLWRIDNPSYCRDRVKFYWINGSNSKQV